MSKSVLVNEDYLDDTGLAIQQKLKSSDKFTPAEFGDSIRAIPIGETDPKFKSWQFYPVNVSDLNMPMVTVKSYDDFTIATMDRLQVNNNRSQISNGNFYYYDSYHSHCLYYYDFGEEITDAVILITKTESSNAFNFAFFNEDPNTFTANTNGIGYYPPSIIGTTPAGTTQMAYLYSPYSARYMVVEVAYDTTVSAPTIIWSDNNHNI